MSKLKSIRVLKCIKQNDFAKMLGITPQYLSKLESGKVDLKRSFMVKASTILSTPVQELFFDN